LNAKFDPTRQFEMKPFFFLRGQGNPDDPIYYDEFGGSMKKIPSVVAEIELFLPEACVSIQQCIDGNPKGVCPILKTPFHVGQPVYIKSEKIPDAIKGLPVVCVSLPGLNVILEQQSASQKVKRNAGSTGNRHELGYDMVWMFDEEAIKKGICGRVPLPEPPSTSSAKKRRGGGKKKKGSGSSGTPQGSSSSPDPFSPPASDLKPEEPEPGDVVQLDTDPDSLKDITAKVEGIVLRSDERINPNIEAPPSKGTLSQQETVITPSKLPSLAPTEKYEDASRQKKKQARLKKGIPSSFLPDPDSPSSSPKAGSPSSSDYFSAPSQGEASPNRQDIARAPETAAERLVPQLRPANRATAPEVANLPPGLGRPASGESPSIPPPTTGSSSASDLVVPKRSEDKPLPASASEKARGKQRSSSPEIPEHVPEQEPFVKDPSFGSASSPEQSGAGGEWQPVLSKADRERERRRKTSFDNAVPRDSPQPGTQSKPGSSTSLSSMASGSSLKKSGSRQQLAGADQQQGMKKSGSKQQLAPPNSSPAMKRSGSRQQLAGQGKSRTPQQSPQMSGKAPPQQPPPIQAGKPETQRSKAEGTSKSPQISGKAPSPQQPLKTEIQRSKAEGKQRAGTPQQSPQMTGKATPPQQPATGRGTPQSRPVPPASDDQEFPPLPGAAIPSGADGKSFIIINIDNNTAASSSSQGASSSGTTFSEGIDQNVPAANSGGSGPKLLSPVPSESKDDDLPPPAPAEPVDPIPPPSTSADSSNTQPNVKPGAISGSDSSLNPEAKVFYPPPPDPKQVPMPRFIGRADPKAPPPPPTPPLPAATPVQYSRSQQTPPTPAQKREMQSQSTQTQAQPSPQSSDGSSPPQSRPDAAYSQQSAATSRGMRNPWDIENQSSQSSQSQSSAASEREGEKDEENPRHPVWDQDKDKEEHVSKSLSSTTTYVHYIAFASFFVLFLYHKIQKPSNGDLYVEFTEDI